MKLKLNKKKLKNLSRDNKTLPADMTALIGGGTGTEGGEKASSPIKCYTHEKFM